MAVLTVADIDADLIQGLFDRYGLSWRLHDAGRPIAGSFWGEPEAGVVGTTVHVRHDTPLHSLLHELSHIVCMDEQRRAALHTNAGSDDDEESAVCYLQILLADNLAGVGRERLMQDMDSWGYSFRLGRTGAWFESDADDARCWLERHGLVDDGKPSFQLRRD